MTEDDTSESPLDAVAGDDATRAAEAFAALGDETRLAILLALWEACDPTDPDDGIPFSDLRERVGVGDSGRFNYHLDRLEGRFVRRVENGYALRRSGRQLVRTVVAGTGIEEPTLEPTVIDADCPYCGAPLAVTYEDEWLYEVCTECPGAYEGGGTVPEGYLAGAALAPAGLTDRSPEEAWAAALTRAYQDTKTLVEGVCNECSGPVDRTLDICEDHEVDTGGDESGGGTGTGAGVCGSCGRRHAAMAVVHCRVCENYHAMPPRTLVVNHPAVVSFYHERGVDLHYDVDDVESVRQRTDLVAGHEQEVVSTDPPRALVTVSYAGDDLRLTVDEELNVVEADEAA
jgi:DNA-binding transcriptional ArsR family regulator